MEVLIVGGVTGSDLDIRGQGFGWAWGGVFESSAWGLERDEGEERERDDDEEDCGFED